MNWDRIEGNWTQLKGKVREQWGKLTDDDIDVIAGKREQLSGKIQERYGIARDEAAVRVVGAQMRFQRLQVDQLEPIRDMRSPQGDPSQWAVDLQRRDVLGHGGAV